MIEHGKPYLVGSVGFEAALLDLTSARAREWVKAVREHRGRIPAPPTAGEVGLAVFGT